MRAFAFSILGIVIANLLLLATGMNSQWEMTQYLLVYWCESAIIGFFTLLKLWLSRSKVGSPLSVTTNGKTKQIDIVTPSGRVSLMGFFCIHFGVFMVGHLLILLIWQSSIEEVSLKLVLGFLPSLLLACVLLLASHTVSFLSHFLWGAERALLSLDHILFSPYPRVLVMHLVVILGAIFGFWPTFVVFVKIGADIFGHYWSHRANQTEKK